MQVGFVNLQRNTPGDGGAHVVVVKVRAVGQVFPILVARCSGVLQVRTTGVQAGITEQHMGAILTLQVGAADLGLPLTTNQFEGNWCVVS